MAEKKRVLLIGSGGIGTITALNLELSNLCTVTCILRSNYSAVSANGFQITAMDYGNFPSWRPSSILNTIPNVTQSHLPPYDYIICTTKNTPDVPPSLTTLIAPSVTPSHSIIVLIQNGINIELPFLSAFPTNIILSGVSRMGANEPTPGHIVQDDNDRLSIAPFHNPNLSAQSQTNAAMAFVKLYIGSKTATCTYDPNVQFGRWRKLVYNCVWNPICALTDCDTGRLRLIALNENYTDADPLALLVRPAMKEVIAVAASVGVELGLEVIDAMLEPEPVEAYCAPSMLQDVRKERFTEVENILGEVVRTAEANGVGVPVIKVMFALLKARQWRTMEKWKMIDVNEEAKRREEMMKAKT